MLAAELQKIKTEKSIRQSSGVRKGFSHIKIEAAVAIVFVSAIIFLSWREASTARQVMEHLSGFFAAYARQFARQWLFNPGFYTALGAALILERLIPARKGQKIAGCAFRQDLIWTFVQIAVSVLCLQICYLTIKSFCDQYFSLPQTGLGRLPLAARWLVAFLVADFAAYLAHILRHKISLLWQFHAVHHSQTDLNFFSESRRHPVDTLVAYVRLYLPFVVLSLPFEVMAATYWLRRWHERLYHCNIKTNLGPLRYVLVTPQSHRVHHSRLIEHRDTNFGETLSIWDHLFGTQFEDYNQYPDTGIEDDGFPLENEGGEHEKTCFGEPIRVLSKQLLYPFRAIARS